MAVEFVDTGQRASYVRQLMLWRLQDTGPNSPIIIRRQVGTRIRVHQFVALDVMAELLGVTRSSLANELLEAAIREAAEVVDIDISSEEFCTKFKERLDYEASARAEAEE